MAEVEVELGGRGVATVWLNRPERHNAYDGALIDGLIAAAERAAVDDAIRVVVLRGRGPSFQAGADLGWLKRMAAADAATNLDFSRRTLRAVELLDALPKPTVALVHGACYGGGVGMVAACDVAIASAETTLAITEARWGVTAAPIVRQLVHAIGRRQARRWALTGERFDAATAMGMELLHEVCPTGGLDAAAAPILDGLLAGGPEAAADIKTLLRTVEVAAPDGESLARRAAARRASPEAAEGLASFLEKRKARWVR